MAERLQYWVETPTMSLTIATGLGKRASGSSQAAIFSSSASPGMRAVERAATEVAPTDIPVFIVGESGTGKGTLATMIHRLSKRSEQELVKVNCQNITANSVAEDGGWRSPLGLTARHLKGTVLLDEVLDLPPGLQSHVMAILPEGDIEPRETRTAPRVIAASRSEARALNGSAINRELYYRLRGMLLRIPPLRERREDIPLLAHFLLNKYASSFGRSSISLSARAEEHFQNHSWPGNVRELENAIKTLLALDDEALLLDSMGLGSADQPYEEQGKPAGNTMRVARTDEDFESTSKTQTIGANGSEVSLSLKETSRNASRIAEKQLITEVLRRTSWNRKRAAKELSISYKALLYKLKQNGLRGPGAAEE
jgi:DNA-binding NtrC family response regulator